MFDPELEQFKTAISLPAFAAADGYTVDKRKSCRGSVVMRHANGDKVIIKRNAADGHYTYFSVRDDKDNGTIIDWLKKRRGLSLGEIREELRPWIGAIPEPANAIPPLVATSKDRLKVEAEYANTREAVRHPYLENERALPASLLQHPRFAGTVRVDARGNAIFRHLDADGICGFEKRNHNYKSFSSGGSKGLWLSNESPGDERQGFFESAIDALSFAALNPDELMRYASISGKPNPVQPELIRAAIALMPAGSEIIAAFDADEDGRKLVEVVRRAFELSGRNDLRFSVKEPDGANDWNDVLRSEPRPILSYRPTEVSPQ